MQKVMRYIAYTAGILFIFLGLAFLFTNVFPENLPVQLKPIAGIVFMLYGIYRIVLTLYKTRKNNADEEYS